MTIKEKEELEIGALYRYMYRTAAKCEICSISGEIDAYAHNFVLSEDHVMLFLGWVETRYNPPSPLSVFTVKQKSPLFLVDETVIAFDFSLTYLKKVLVEPSFPEMENAHEAT